MPAELWCLWGFLRTLQGVDFVVDGGERLAYPSTVIDMTGLMPTILRRGKVSTSSQFVIHDSVTTYLLVLLLCPFNVALQNIHKVHVATAWENVGCYSSLVYLAFHLPNISFRWCWQWFLISLHCTGPCRGLDAHGIPWFNRICWVGGHVESVCLEYGFAIVFNFTFVCNVYYVYVNSSHSESQRL